MAAKPSIGRLRWPVTIAQRVQTPAGTSSIAESLSNLMDIRADIQPLGPMTFLAGEQTDRPITHRITIRWLDWLDLTHVVIRSTLRLDGTQRMEVFRLRKIGEVDGRKRFLELLGELEQRV